MATRPLFTQDLPDLDTTFREHAREDSRLECLALYAGQTGEQGRRRNKVSTVPRSIFAALLDNVQLIADFER